MIKKNFGLANIKLKDKLSYLISFREFDENINFIDKLLNVLEKSKMDTYVLDSKYMYEENNFKQIKYI